MTLTDLLTTDRVVMLVEAGDRDTVLDAAARLLADASPTHTALLGASLRQRENISSTAIGHGVAIPHARNDAYQKPRGAFLRLDRPVAFNAVDGKPVDLVFAMSVPGHSTAQHLRILAELAERFADAGFREALREAADISALRTVLFDASP